MKYSDILFEKTCVNLYIQKHRTACKMLEGFRKAGSCVQRRAGRRVKRMRRRMECKQCKKDGDEVSLGNRKGSQTGVRGVQNVLVVI